MNSYGSIEKIAKKFKQPLDADVLCQAGYSTNSWSIQLKRGAIIRAWLFQIINNEKADNDNENEIMKFLDDTALTNYQQRISSLKYTYGYKTQENNYVLDYALMNNLDEDNYNTNRALVGERYFLYNCFRQVYTGQFSEIKCNLFYMYLVIKAQFRGELVKINDRVGFNNFSEYQDRKSYFTDLEKCYEEEVCNLALNSTLEDQRIKSLEARIVPKDTPKKVRQAIKYYDGVKVKTKQSSDIMHSIYKDIDYILEGKKKSDTGDDKYFYVLHFLKAAFTLDKDENEKFIGKYRNYSIRQQNEKKAKAVAQALANNYELRKRIKGIDGCSSEIGCRPEVLATELRYLSNYNPISTLSYTRQSKEPMKLRITYHAGEDFLDIVNGLRAIDETIFFIGLNRDDRIGHALALGIDVRDYYEMKNNKVMLTKQDMLDNVIWLLNKSISLNVLLDLTLQSKLKCIFDELSDYIYGDFAREYKYNSSFSAVNSNEFKCECRIKLNRQTYYKAWKLRGDHPKFYRMGKYVYSKNSSSEYQHYSKNPQVDDSVRNDRDIALLYYAYHYDAKVKEKGLETYIYKVDASAIKLVEELQHEMQFEIAGKGIAIESNPSSNYLIGTFKRFDKHPILRFYNTSLEIEPSKINSSPQLSVSINTDDQGVFDTYLENEYAVMAAALEKMQNENGNKMYSSAQIYHWLDDVRQMGLEQSFK